MLRISAKRCDHDNSFVCHSYVSRGLNPPAKSTICKFDPGGGGLNSAPMHRAEGAVWRQNFASRNPFCFKCFQITFCNHHVFNALPEWGWGGGTPYFAGYFKSPGPKKRGESSLCVLCALCVEKNFRHASQSRHIGLLPELGAMGETRASAACGCDSVPHEPVQSFGRWLARKSVAASYAPSTRYRS